MSVSHSSWLSHWLVGTGFASRYRFQPIHKTYYLTLLDRDNPDSCVVYPGQRASTFCGFQNKYKQQQQQQRRRMSTPLLTHAPPSKVPGGGFGPTTRDLQLDASLTPLVRKRQARGSPDACHIAACFVMFTARKLLTPTKTLAMTVPNLFSGINIADRNRTQHGMTVPRIIPSRVSHYFLLLTLF